MAASETVPLVLTYAPGNGPTTTATVLGQVLNNGETNWIPSGNNNAIYLATDSDAGAETVLDGQTYYITTGPAVPNQATGVTVTGMMPSATQQSADSSTDMMMEESSASGPASQSAMASSSSSSSGEEDMDASSSASASPSSGSSRTISSSSFPKILTCGLALYWLIGSL